MTSDGFILLDLRRRKADAGIEGLSALGSVDVIEEAAYGSAKRVLVRKGAVGA